MGKVGGTTFCDKFHKGVYVVDCFSWFADCFAFNKKYYKTKEDAVEKFKEITNNADILGEVEESYVRFLWWTETHGYEYPEEETACGYRTVKEKGNPRGVMDCLIINQDMHWERCITEE